jgi:hypothetical protein
VSPFRAPQRDLCRGPRSLPTCARRGLRKESAIATDDADDRQLIEEQGGGWPEARARFWLEAAMIHITLPTQYTTCSARAEGSVFCVRDGAQPIVSRG